MVGSVLSRLFLILFLVVASSGSSIAKYAAIILDNQTGKVLHEEHADKITHPASLTKMMTLFKVFQALEMGRLSLEQPLKVSRFASKQEPCKLGLRPGQVIKAKDAIMAMITKSANDAAVTLAEALGGTETKFAQIMTVQARALGMQKTVFKNASGLPNMQQVTTARDMAKLSQALIRHFPHYYKYFATKAFNYKGTNHHNHNHLVGEVIGHKGAPIVIDGIKTGFINASGFNLAASAKLKNHRVVGVVMGGPNRHWRDRRMKELLKWAFGVAPQSETPRLIKTNLTTVTKASQEAKNKKVKTKKPTQKKASKAKKALKSAKGAKLTLVSQAVPASAGKWRVQVGAFARLKDAQNTLKKVQAKVKLLKAAKSTSSPVGKRKKMYRAQFANLSKQNAQNACSQVRRNGFECMVVAG